MSWKNYRTQLNELNGQVTLKIEQLHHEGVNPVTKQPELLQNMKTYKGFIDTLSHLLLISKSDINSDVKRKFPSLQKYMRNFINSDKNRSVPSEPQGHSQSMPRHLPSQVAQLQQHDDHVNELQQMNMQCSVALMQSAAAPSMQHGSMPLSMPVNVPTTQQNMANTLQPTPSLDPTKQVSLDSMQQGTVGLVQQDGVGSLQTTISASQHLHLKKQHHEQQQQLFQTRPMKQQFEQHQMQLLMQKQQKKQLIQQPPPMQLHQQQKQQEVTQLPPHQMPQHQKNDVNELNRRQSSGIKSGLYQQHYRAGQHHNYSHQQLKAGGPFPISSPQNLQAMSPQVSQHSSPQIDQNILLSSLPKAPTPLHSTLISSPCTPKTPSPVPGDPEKHSGISQLSNAVVIGHQQATFSSPQSHAITISTPGISASQLLEEFTSPDVCEANVVCTTTLGKSNAKEQPIKHIIKAVQSSSPKKLSSYVNYIGSVISMIDGIAGSAPGNGSRAAIGEDLVASTKCHLKGQELMSQDGNNMTKKLKRDLTAMPLNVMPSAVSMSDSFEQLYESNISELDSTTTSNFKRRKVEVMDALLEEMDEINQKMIAIEITVSEDADVFAAAAGGEGMVIKCSFNAVFLCPNLKSQFASNQMPPIVPLRFLIPTNYPKSSPIILDMAPSELSKEFRDLSVKAWSRFRISLHDLPLPLSLREIVKTWDDCARKVIEEYAQQNGGGSFGSRFCVWENCVRG